MNLLISERDLATDSGSVRQRSSKLKDGRLRQDLEGVQKSEKGKSRDSRLARVFGFDGKEEQ
jgi:hypothetical protein